MWPAPGLCRDSEGKWPGECRGCSGEWTGGGSSGCGSPPPEAMKLRAWSASCGVTGHEIKCGM